VSGWDAILGHERVVKSLRRAVREDRPNHAYLFLGPEGVGKRTLADTLARALVCDADEGVRPCGLCGPCGKVASGSHPDVWSEEPSGKSHTITSDQITEIQRRLSYRRAEGRHRVVILDEAGTMNTQAQNKLLKTLEEPPPSTVLILCALHPGQLLITVRSRCQKVALGAVPHAAVEAWLVDQHGAAREEAVQAAAAGRGLPGRALALMDSDLCAERESRLAQLGEAMAGKREAIDLLARSVDRDRAACEEVLGTLQELLRDAMLSVAGTGAAPIHPGQAPHSGLLTALDARQLADRVGRIEVSRGRLRRNVDPAGLLEDLLVHLSVEAPRP
jgi:DNA polymerase-3 subunit delta'